VGQPHQTASHYLKLLLDSVFGVDNFRSEIIWKRTYGHGNVGRSYGSVCDNILVCSRGPAYTWNQPYAPASEEYIRQRFSYTDPEGRHWQSVTLRNPSPRPNLRFPFTASNGVTYQPHPNGWSCDKTRLEQYDREGRLHFPAKPTGQLRLKMYLDESPGQKVQNLWSDIYPVNSQAAERLGYPTQKPEALLERIIQTSSDEGDVVLDPFCGCGTSIAVAQRLNRRWIGIDITYLAIDLIRNRLRGVYGDAIETTYTVDGIPADEDSARALFAASPFDFERWAVSLVDGTPNEKQVGDRGVDGVVRFPLDARGGVGRALVSVKGGKLLNPGMVRDLVGTVGSQHAEMGLLTTLEHPTRGMEDAARHSGTFTWEVNHQPYPMAQLLTVGDLLAGQRPQMPTPFLPYIQAKRLAAPNEQLTLG
jgi:DNA modification methylase